MAELTNEGGGQIYRACPVSRDQTLARADLICNQREGHACCPALARKRSRERNPERNSCGKCRRPARVPAVPHCEVGCLRRMRGGSAQRMYTIGGKQSFQAVLGQEA